MLTPTHTMQNISIHISESSNNQPDAHVRRIVPFADLPALTTDQESLGGNQGICCMTLCPMHTPHPHFTQLLLHPDTLVVMTGYMRRQGKGDLGHPGRTMTHQSLSQRPSSTNTAQQCQLVPPTLNSPNLFPYVPLKQYIAGA